MDYAKLLYAAAVRDLATSRLNGQVPQDLRGDDRLQWKRERLDEYLLAADKELKRVSALLDQPNEAE